MKVSRLTVLVLIAAAIFVETGCSGPTSSTPPQSMTTKFTNERITAANYETIKVGMKETEIISLLGEPANTRFSAAGLELKLDGKPVDRFLIWKDESDGSVKEIVVWIKDDQIVDKGQSGLIAKPNQ